MTEEEIKKLQEDYAKAQDEITKLKPSAIELQEERNKYKKLETEKLAIQTLYEKEKDELALEKKLNDRWSALMNEKESTREDKISQNAYKKALENKYKK